MPSVSLACEGAAEEQTVSLKPILWSGGGACSEKEVEKVKKVHFTVVGQWCEYELKNENKIEQVELIDLGLHYPAGEPGCKENFVVCLGFPKNVSKKPECAFETKLAAKGGQCFTRIEYIKKPRVKVEMSYLVSTKSTNGGFANPEVYQLVE